MFIEDTITDIVRFIEDSAGILIAMLIVFGVPAYMLYSVDPMLMWIAIGIFSLPLLPFILYAIVANIVGI